MVICVVTTHGLEKQVSVFWICNHHEVIEIQLMHGPTVLGQSDLSYLSSSSDWETGKSFYPRATTANSTKDLLAQLATR